MHPNMHSPSQMSLEPVLKLCLLMCLYHCKEPAVGLNAVPSKGVVNQRPSEVVGQTDHDLPQLYHQNIMYLFHLYLGLLFYVSPVELSSL